MKQKTIEIRLMEYSSPEELSAQEQQLVAAAIKVSGDAYAPYSGFKVGAAILLENGEIVTGNNQENAAYPSGMCAERVALYWAGSQYPEVAVRCMAVAAIRNGKLIDQVISPCGSCRQVFAETQHRHGNSFPLLLVGRKMVLKLESAASLLPLAFGPEEL
jgi:cytidine deaminase